MQRSSIIATVVAAGGVLIAGSVASVAVINAASSSEIQATNLDLVADDAPASPTAAPVLPASDPTVTPMALPSLEASELPELPEVDDASTAAAPAAPQAQPVAKAAKAAKTPSRDASTSAPAQTADPGLSSDEARSIVMKQGDGVKTLAVSKETHQGYKTWAVRIERASGEVITGYVLRENGDVIDWVVNSQPVAPASTPSSSASHDDDSDEHKSEDHSGSDDDEHESEDNSGSDHDSDDD